MTRDEVRGFITGIFVAYAAAAGMAAINGPMSWQNLLLWAFVHPAALLLSAWIGVRARRWWDGRRRDAGLP